MASMQLVFLCIAPEVSALDQRAEDVLESQVCLLDVHGDLRRHAQAMVAERRHLAAALSGEADGYDAL